MKKTSLNRGSYYYNTIATAESIRRTLNWNFSDILNKIIINIPDTKIDAILTEVASYYNEHIKS
jgi:hypothetical protein